MKPVWIAAGLLCIPVAVAGIVLPLLPTTPFLLLAAFCFDRGSPRLHAWLLDHRLLGGPIRSWREHRAIPRPTKISAGSLMLIALASSLLIGVATWMLVVQLLIFAAVSAFIFTRPSGPRRPGD